MSDPVLYDVGPNLPRVPLKATADGALTVSVVSGEGATSDMTEATQLLVKAAVQNIDTGLGAPANTPATSDAGAFSLIALMKRALGNWTTLLARIPALVNTRTPVDTDRVTKQVIDAASATVTYVCEAQAVNTATSAAGWRIKRITVAGSVTTIQWGGTGAFDQIADNRATTVVYA
jgi:hypothetical protein